MKTSIRLAALLITGAVFVGCDKKDNTPPTTPPTPTTPGTPVVPDASKTGSAINNTIDKGAAAAKTEADKLTPTTMPTLPTLPK